MLNSWFLHFSGKKVFKYYKFKQIEIKAMETPRFTMVEASFTGKDGNLYLLEVFKFPFPFTFQFRDMFWQIVSYIALKEPMYFPIRKCWHFHKCISLHRILKVKIVKNLSLFLHQCTFKMHRPKLYSISQCHGEASIKGTGLHLLGNS